MNADLAMAVIAAVLVVLAGVTTSIDAALSTFSRARAEELAEDGRAGAARLRRMLDDPAPFINMNLLIRVAAETAAIVLATTVVFRLVDRGWLALVIAIVGMSFLSYVVIGVGPRTIGRQHSERVALLTAWPLGWFTRLLGPVPTVMIMLGNAITPGRGFAEGPFASEVEVREMVDLAEASMLIESDESKMIHKVFELGDTIVREVMVPRPDLVYIERYKTLRQAMSLALRSGYSRIPVVDDNDLDDIIGMAYLKDITRRVYDNREAEHTEKVEMIMRDVLFVPDSKPADDLLREMQSDRLHVAVVVDEFGGTAGMVTIEDIVEEIVGEITDEYDSDPFEVEELADGSLRVSARFATDDLAELLGAQFDDEDVDTVRGLMAKYLGKVPIPGTAIDVEGFEMTAESPTGRRNRVGTVRIRRPDLDDSVA